MNKNTTPKGIEVDDFIPLNSAVVSTRQKWYEEVSTPTPSPTTFEIITYLSDDFSMNIDIALLSFLKLHEQLKENEKSKIRLNIVLSGNVLDFIKSLIESMSLTQYTRIVNINDFSEIDKICNRAHLFLNPSKNNQVQFTYTALEKGIPVVCFDNYWTRNLVTDKCGFRIPFNHLSYCKNIDAFSAHLYSLFSNLNLFQNLSKGASERYSEILEV